MPTSKALTFSLLAALIWAPVAIAAGPTANIPARLASPSQIEFHSLSEVELANLQTLCKVWGFLKYHHPHIAGGNVDWDAELLRFLPAAGSKNFQHQLLLWAKQLGSFQRSNEPAAEPTDQSIEIANMDWLSDEAALSKAMSQLLMDVRYARRPATHAYVGADQWGITPRFIEASYPEMDFSDDGHKLLLLFRYWNIVEYFFPYKRYMDDDWDEVLNGFLPRFVEDTDELSFKLLLLELIATLKDGHAFLVSDERLNRFFGERQLPVELVWLDGHAIVAERFEAAASRDELQSGDTVTSIDGVPVRDLVEQKQKYISASTAAAFARELGQLLIRTNKARSTLVINRDGRRLAVEVDTISYRVTRFIQRDLPALRRVHDDIAVLYPGALKPDEVEGLLTEVKGMPALIIDYRCYPSQSMQQELPRFLLRHPEQHFVATQFNPTSAGRFSWKPIAFAGVDNDSPYQGRVAILVNEYTQSQPEFEILALLNRPDLIIVGSPTAGAVGNWTPIPLPGNITTSFSGNGIYTHQRKQVQRVGVPIDIKVQRTVAGIRAGNDEIMQQAVNAILQR